ncbi:MULTISPECIES: 2,3-diaminopropionate biosynthesis protein SbnB [Paenibacillus]|uniref:2,3-diaminopropionate biosynthesis protein SbnB n=1 Tax=Paenibacillus TaxID=44249 RepID=UPI0022B88EB4|nr:2,3-diaminopropionate biosynthesis protein SbnB [Paenibacillus caseinilyticus]MCZ8522692.1 2,3-diaminopropionate biosynthesis protein SbnB [Paenibacillus caseinilyticus]
MTNLATQQDQMVLLTGDEIVDILSGREVETVQIVQAAYQIHSLGDSELPHSTFLRFPNRERERIIALTAYLGGDFQVAGLKWIASFPDNIHQGIERASATLILNDMRNGRPKAILESSVISAKRTAAGAALAADKLLEDKPLLKAGIIGCGLINFETFQFLMSLRPELQTLLVYDVDQGRAEQYKRKCQELAPHVKILLMPEMESILAQADVVALATTAVKPHIQDLSMCSPDTVILHTSLRDISADAILAADNVVDDIDHCCRAQTSVHLAEQQSGDRTFIRATIGDILLGKARAKERGKPVVYSAFGLGILDIALGEYVYQRALEHQAGTRIGSFFPASWLEREISNS